MLLTNYLGDVISYIEKTALTTSYNISLFAGMFITIISLSVLLNKLKSKYYFYIFIPLLLSPLRLRYSMEWPNHANWGWIILYISFLHSFLKNPLSLKMNPYEANFVGSSFARLRKYYSSRHSFLTRKIKYPILAGIFFFIALIENAYHGVELFFISIPLFIFAIYINKNELTKKTNVTIFLKNIAIFSTIIIASIFYQYWVYTQPVQYGTNDITTVISSATRSPSDRWAYSARPWHYLIPDIDHPVFGDLAVKTHYFIWRHPPYYLTEPFFPKEHTLFLGYTLMALTLYTIWQTYIKKRIKGDQRFTVTFFLIILVTALIFSMPPYLSIGGLKIYFPSHFIYEFLPQFRAYARYGVFVFIANTIIATIGLNYLASKSFINKSNQKLKQNILILLISTLAIFEFIPGKHLISILPTPPYVDLIEEAKTEPFAILEIPTRADYTDQLYLFESNVTILNPYLTTRGDARILEDIIWMREKDNLPLSQIDRDILFCETFKKLNAKYILYHEKEVNKEKVVNEFKQTKIVTPQLKVAMAESWGQPIWGNHVPKTDKDLLQDEIRINMRQILLENEKFEFVKYYTNDEIIESRPNKNFSADKFDAVTIFKLNEAYCPG